MSQDFVVIGAGIIGLATALELAKRGGKVTVLERAVVGGESSWAGVGILSALPPWKYVPAGHCQLNRKFVDWHPLSYGEKLRVTRYVAACFARIALS